MSNDSNNHAEPAPLDVLRGYPAKALVSDFYDADDKFSSALISIFGDSFEYPDFSHRKIGSVVKLALSKSMSTALNGITPAEQQPSPDMCFAFNESAGPGNYVVAIRRGESGFFKTTYDELDPAKARELSQFMNRKLGVSVDEAERMNVGAMFGWNVPGAQVPAMEQSRFDAKTIARTKGTYSDIDVKADQTLVGKVLGVTSSHVVLSLGRSAAIVAQSDLSRVPAMGEDATIVFKDGKGLVADASRSKGADKGR